MSDEVLIEEFEVLESIYPDEITKVSDRELSIVVEPEEPVVGLGECEWQAVIGVKLSLHVSYPPEYPDVYPNVSLDPVEEEDRGDEAKDLTSEERTHLLESMQEIGNENIGMAMTFTLVSHLREQLSAVLKERAEKLQREEMEKERKALEEEEARTRGTPVTAETFNKWRTRFMAEQGDRKKREEEERMKGWTPKEREEARRVTGRLTGRQLFERGGPQAMNLEDASLFEEGTESVDITMFDREERGRQEEEQKGAVDLSDSD